MIKENKEKFDLESIINRDESELQFWPDEESSEEFQRQVLEWWEKIASLLEKYMSWKKDN